MDEISDIDVAKELIALCRAGKLYEIDRWIAGGKSLDISVAKKRGRQRGLLELAVETGFHSLVELIAKNESCQSARDAALMSAVSSRRMDLVELLVAYGADVGAIPLVEVLVTWEPKLMRFFLDRGADPLDGRPFAEAFREKIRTTLRVFVDYRQSHPELAAQMQEQVDCALRYFCGQGDLKWVSLMTWAGGDPRSRGPNLEKDYTEDPECYTSGLEEACYSGHVEVLKKLKPHPEHDNVTELLRCASICRRVETLAYLLQLGVNPNDKANGGSSALDSVLRMNFFSIDAFGSNRLSSKYDVRRDLDAVSTLLSHGADWRPDGAPELNSLRRALLGCDPEVTIELLQMFRKHNACAAETVHKLLGTPRMREHLKPQTHALLRLGIHLEDRPIKMIRKRYGRMNAGA
jgi:hypothetical protein